MDIPDTQEWLLTNGLGGYASGTVCGANLRRYHGLLIVAEKPPRARRVLLSRVEECLIAGEGTYGLTCNAAPEIQGGFEHLKTFCAMPVPTWVYQVPGGTLTKQLFCPPGHPTTVLGYRWQGHRGITLAVKLFANDRDHHGQSTGDFAIVQRTDDRGIFSVQAQFIDGSLGTRWYWRCAPFRDVEYHFEGRWQSGFYWPIEAERGLPDTESLFMLGTVHIALQPGDWVSLTFSTEPDVRALDIRDLTSRHKDELYRAVNRAHLPKTQLSEQFVQAADQFVVQRPGTGETTIVAGYPWFSDWGRDAMLSLNGLLLVTGRWREAQSVLQTFGKAMADGLIPNLFPESDEAPAYNTIDATLLWFDSMYNYYRQAEDEKLIRDLYPKMVESIDAHVAGTQFGIHLDTDGLLMGGDAQTQLTWMDTRFTPRHGKPVEINALWYNALRIMETFSVILGEESQPYTELAEKAASSLQKFWNKAKGCLYDLLEDKPDKTLRPNQLFALSLSFCAFTPEQSQSILTLIQTKLLTPYGLRTLDPAHRCYALSYKGDTEARDKAYHQGTVWPWLLGPFCVGYLNTFGRTPETFAQVRNWLLPLLDYLQENGTIPEIFDGSLPHKPRGCIAQAWSVAQILALYSELSESGVKFEPELLAGPMLER